MCSWHHPCTWMGRSSGYGAHLREHRDLKVLFSFFRRHLKAAPRPIVCPMVGHHLSKLFMDVPTGRVQAAIHHTFIIEDALVTAPELDVVTSHATCLFCKRDDAEVGRGAGYIAVAST